MNYSNSDSQFDSASRRQNHSSTTPLAPTASISSINQPPTNFTLSQEDENNHVARSASSSQTSRRSSYAIPLPHQNDLVHSAYQYTSSTNPHISTLFSQHPANSIYNKPGYSAPIVGFPIKRLGFAGNDSQANPSQLHNESRPANSQNNHHLSMNPPQPAQFSQRSHQHQIPSTPQHSATQHTSTPTHQFSLSPPLASQPNNHSQESFLSQINPYHYMFQPHQSIPTQPQSRHTTLLHPSHDSATLSQSDHSTLSPQQIPPCHQSRQSHRNTEHSKNTKSVSFLNLSAFSDLTSDQFPYTTDDSRDGAAVNNLSSSNTHQRRNFSTLPTSYRSNNSRHHLDTKLTSIKLPKTQTKRKPRSFHQNDDDEDIFSSLSSLSSDSSDFSDLDSAESSQFSHKNNRKSSTRPKRPTAINKVSQTSTGTVTGSNDSPQYSSSLVNFLSTTSEHSTHQILATAHHPTSSVTSSLHPISSSLSLLLPLQAPEDAQLKQDLLAAHIQKQARSFNELFDFEFDTKDEGKAALLAIMERDGLTMITQANGARSVSFRCPFSCRPTAENHRLRAASSMTTHTTSVRAISTVPRRSSTRTTTGSKSRSNSKNGKKASKIPPSLALVYSNSLAIPDSDEIDSSSASEDEIATSVANMYSNSSSQLTQSRITTPSADHLSHQTNCPFKIRLQRISKKLPQSGTNVLRGPNGRVQRTYVWKFVKYSWVSTHNHPIHTPFLVVKTIEGQLENDHHSVALQGDYDHDINRMTDKPKKLGKMTDHKQKGRKKNSKKRLERNNRLDDSLFSSISEEGSDSSDSSDLSDSPRSIKSTNSASLVKSRNSTKSTTLTSPDQLQHNESAPTPTTQIVFVPNISGLQKYGSYKLKKMVLKQAEWDMVEKLFALGWTAPSILGFFTRRHEKLFSSLSIPPPFLLTNAQLINYKRQVKRKYGKARKNIVIDPNVDGYRDFCQAISITQEYINIQRQFDPAYLLSSDDEVQLEQGDSNQLSLQDELGSQLSQNRLPGGTPQQDEDIFGIGLNFRYHNEVATEYAKDLEMELESNLQQPKKRGRMQEKQQKHQDLLLQHQKQQKMEEKMRREAELQQQAERAQEGERQRAFEKEQLLAQQRNQLLSIGGVGGRIGVKQQSKFLKSQRKPTTPITVHVSSTSSSAIPPSNNVNIAANTKRSGKQENKATDAVTTSITSTSTVTQAPYRTKTTKNTPLSKQQTATTTPTAATSVSNLSSTPASSFCSTNSSHTDSKLDFANLAASAKANTSTSNTRSELSTIDDIKPPMTHHFDEFELFDDMNDNSWSSDFISHGGNEINDLETSLVARELPITVTTAVTNVTTTPPSVILLPPPPLQYTTSTTASAQQSNINTNPSLNPRDLRKLGRSGSLTNPSRRKNTNNQTDTDHSDSKRSINNKPTPVNQTVSIPHIVSSTHHNANKQAAINNNTILTSFADISSSHFSTSQSSAHPLHNSQQQQQQQQHTRYRTDVKNGQNINDRNCDKQQQKKLRHLNRLERGNFYEFHPQTVTSVVFPPMRPSFHENDLNNIHAGVVDDQAAKYPDRSKISLLEQDENQGLVSNQDGIHSQSQQKSQRPTVTSSIIPQSQQSGQKPAFRQSTPDPQQLSSQISHPGFIIDQPKQNHKSHSRIDINDAETYPTDQDVPQHASIDSMKDNSFLVSSFHQFASSAFPASMYQLDNGSYNNSTRYNHDYQHHNQYLNSKLQRGNFAHITGPLSMAPLSMHPQSARKSPHHTNPQNINETPSAARDHHHSSSSMRNPTSITRGHTPASVSKTPRKLGETTAPKFDSNINPASLHLLSTFESNAHPRRSIDRNGSMPRHRSGNTSFESHTQNSIHQQPLQEEHRQTRVQQDRQYTTFASPFKQFARHTPHSSNSINPTNLTNHFNSANISTYPQLAQNPFQPSTKMPFAAQTVNEANPHQSILFNSSKLSTSFNSPLSAQQSHQHQLPLHPLSARRPALHNQHLSQSNPFAQKHASFSTQSNHRKE